MSDKINFRPSLEGFKNLSPEQKDKYCYHICYGTQQNHKIPFFKFLARPRQLIILMSVFLFYYLSSDSIFEAVFDSSVYLIGIAYLLFRFTKLKKENLLD